MPDGPDEEAIRLTAYFLWEQDGRPFGKEMDYWRQARERHARERTYDRMIRQAPPREQDTRTK
jgi:hypothetical protein